jgi:hypothetical protein
LIAWWCADAALAGKAPPSLPGRSFSGRPPLPSDQQSTAPTATVFPKAHASTCGLAFRSVAAGRLDAAAQHRYPASLATGPSPRVQRSLAPALIQGRCEVSGQRNPRCAGRHSNLATSTSTISTSIERQQGSKYSPIRLQCRGSRETKSPFGRHCTRPTPNTHCVVNKPAHCTWPKPRICVTDATE